MKKTLGPAFSEQLTRITSKSFTSFELNEDWKDFLLPKFSLGDHSKPKGVWRTMTLLVVAIILYFGLLLRLFHLQVVYGEKNRELADGNRIAIKVIHAPRGVIYDRNGKILASNSPAFRLYDESLKKSIIISREEALEWEVKGDPRFNKLEIDALRSYPQKEAESHLVGYVGEISSDQLKDPKYKDYKVGDRVGLAGVENVYESYLRGLDGGEIIEVDAAGKKLRTLRTVEMIAGNNVYLTIDADLQKVVFDSLKEAVLGNKSCCGAAVISDPQTGQMLSLVSYPAFDPNVFTKEGEEDLVADLLSSPVSPILNRAISGTYPPGSTFKIITSIAGLTSGKVNPQTQIEDTGEIFLGPFRFTNWYFTEYGKTEGPVDMVKALKRSNDTYFYRVGERIGEKALVEWSKKLNLGQTLGVDLPGESQGLVPDNDWKMGQFREPWYPGDTFHMAIGQGFLLVTPLQVLGYTSFIAADGVLHKPKLLLRVVSPQGQTLKEFQSETLVSDLINKDQLGVIKKGLTEAAAEGGTAWPLFYFPIQTAGKTGTAEFGDPKGRTHAWYTGFAPADDPKIAVTALIEAGGEGSSVAVPVVKKIFAKFFSVRDEVPVATGSAALGE